jgi:hypothetical protein
MAKNYTQISNSLNAGNIMGWGNALNRKNPVPVDATSIYNSFDEAVYYASENPVAYEGQVITVSASNDVTVYVITTTSQGTHTITSGDHAGTYSVYIKKVGTAPVGDDASIEVDDDGVVSLKGFSEAANARVPKVVVSTDDNGNETRSLTWATIESLQNSNTVTTIVPATDADVTATATEDEDGNYEYAIDVAKYSVAEEYSGDDKTTTYTISKQLGSTTATELATIVVPDAYDDSDLAGRVDDVVADIEDISADIDAITNETTGTLTIVEGRVDTIEKELEPIKVFFEGADYDGEGANGLYDALDTLADIQSFINGDGAGASNLVAKVSANTEAIGDSTKGLIKAVADANVDIGTNTDAIDAINKAIVGYSETSTVAAAIADAKKAGTDAAAAAATADGKAVNAQNTAAAVKAAVENAETGLAKTKQIADNAATDVATVKETYVRFAEVTKTNADKSKTWTETKLFAGDSEDVIIFNCGSATTNQ